MLVIPKQQTLDRIQGKFGGPIELKGAYTIH